MIAVRHIPSDSTGKASDLRSDIIGGEYTVDLMNRVGTFEIALVPTGAKYGLHDLVEIHEDSGRVLRGEVEEITHAPDRTTLKGSMRLDELYKRETAGVA